MRLFALLLALVFTLSVSAQSNDLLKYTRYRYLYGNATARLQADTVLMTPTDTIYSKDGLARLGNTLWIGNSVYWSQVGFSSTDTIIKIPPGHNGGGRPGQIRFNDTLFIFEVSKDTVFVPILIEATNGLTKALDTVLWGGTLNRETEIDQATNGITFHDGLFIHGTGDFVNQATAYSRLENGPTVFQSSIWGGGNASTTILNTIAGGQGQFDIQATDGSLHTSQINVGGAQSKITLLPYSGNLFVPFLIDSAQDYVLHYNPTNYKVTYSALGGGGSGISGITAEQGLTATSVSNVRWGGTLNVGDVDIDQNANGITFHDGLFKHGTGDYTGLASAYSLLQSTDQFFQVDHDNGSGTVNTIQSSLASGGQINLKQFSPTAISELNLSANDGTSLRNSDGKFFIPDLIDSAQAYTLQYNPTNFKVTYALNGGGGGGGGGSGLSQNAANGVSMRNDSTVILGGSLDQQTTIDGGSSFSLNVTGSRGSGQSTFTGSNSSSGAGITGSNSSTGPGIKASSASGTGLEATSSTLPASFQVNDAATTSYALGLTLIHGTSGTASTNFGLKVPITLENSSGAFSTAASFGAKWTTATAGATVGQLEIFTVNAGVEARALAITGAKEIIADGYGSGARSGTPTYDIQVDAAGKFIEVPIGSGAGDNWGTQVVQHNATLINQGIIGSLLGADTTNYVATKTDVDNAAKTTISPGTGISVSGSPSSGYTITNTGAPGTNPHNALDIRDYGGLADAVVPGSGANVTGTDNSAALEAMIADAADGQLMVIPEGKWRFSTVIDTFETKRINLLILGDTYHNQQDFLIFGPSSGAFKQHRVEHRGLAWGRVNLPTHSSPGAPGGRVSPNWSAYTGTFIKVYNTDQVTVKFNKIIGFKNGLEVIGSGGNGAQENTFVGGWIQECANGIKLTSLDGSSFVDKNKFDVQRIGGGLCLNIDGFSGTASNGEQWNGAFRSNEFKFLVEFADSAIRANGDITEPRFDITIEGGTTTGVFAATNVIQCRSVSPNYVRAPKWIGQGVFGTQWMVNGMGIDGTLNIPVWLGPGSLAYIGNTGIIDGSGRIIIDVKKSLSQSTRSALPSNIKTSNLQTDVRGEVTVTSSTYTVGADDYVIKTNGAGFSVVVTLPSASANPGREIFIKNISSTGGETTSGGDSIGNNTIASGPGGLHYRSNGSTWTLLTRWHD
jgi:hypothetical protein